ncbi:hypothetical protein [Aeromonas dhakensis]|uniref:hypothetical protein n=1 Tax=Aeromonas dhakensis TaxID=196024 RepID=UPI000AC518BB|nr:hypothetical protein [Aeromonas dhakensis]
MSNHYDNGAISAEMAKRKYTVEASINGGPWATFSSVGAFRKQTRLNLCAHWRALHVAMHGGHTIQVGDRLPVLELERQHLDGGPSAQCRVVFIRRA